MKKILIMVFILILSGCGISKNSVTFTGVIESVSDHQMLVTTTDNVGFDKASVSYSDLTLDFEPAPEQSVIITIWPEIRESYPVQVTAKKIVLQQEGQMKQKLEYQKITPEAAKSMMDVEGVIVLDVRTPEEYRSGHIQNAVNIEDSLLINTIEDVVPDKDTKILLYCRSGRRSAFAAKTLLDLGYSSVYDFGGIIDWPYDVVK